MHELLVYTGSNAVPANNFDLTAATDADFSIRNGHYIFTEQYRLGYVLAQSTNITDARLLAPTYAAINSDGFRVAGFQKKAGLGGTPTLADRYLDFPVPIPQMEEVQFQASTGTAQQQWGALSLLTAGWTPRLPTGMPMVMEGTTASFTPAANVWSGPQALTLTSNPRGGVYAVVGAACQQAADTFAFRLIFPRTALYNGRKLRPGWFAQNAVGDFEDIFTQMNRFHLGVWGYFHTFELPQVEVFASTSAAMTPIFRLWTIYLGQDLAQLNSLIGQMG